METLLSLTEPWLYVLVFVLAAAEGAALIGLVLPGESSMLLAGVVVYQGNADALLIYLCGIVGAIAGDSAGYWIGRRFGPRLRSSRLGRKVGDERWERAGVYLRERGGRAVFFGRFAGFLRSLVPPVAGQAHMPYRRFLAFNAPAAALWAVVFISLGLLAGSSWHTVERWSGRASAFVAVLAIGIIALVLVARWLLGHREKALELWRRTIESAPARVARSRYARQISFLRRRFDTRERFGLLFSLGALAAIVMGVAVAGLVDALREGDELGTLDRTVSSFAADHRSDAIGRAADLVTDVLNSVWLTLVTGATAVGAWRWTGRPAWLAAGIVCVTGSLLLDGIVRFLLDVAGLQTPGPFPNGDALSAVVALGLGAYLAGSARGWRFGVSVGTAGTVLLLVLVLAYVYEGVPASALIGGTLLGGFWLAVCAASAAQFGPATDGSNP